jgi:hypothetical protein
MKKSIVLVMAITLALGVAGQRIGHGGYYAGGYTYRPSVVVGIGGYYPVFPGPYLGYGLYYPYPYYGYGYLMPTRMEAQEQAIRNDYADKIASVRADKELTHAQRKDKIKDLKAERDKRIHDLKSNYYKN